MPSDHCHDQLESQIESLLAAEVPPAGWQDRVRELFQRYQDQQRLLDRLTRIADRFQAAERERSQCYLSRYERKVRQLEKIVRISDQYQMMLHQLKERLEHASNYDALTSLPNRRYMTQRLEEAAARVLREADQHFVVMLADVDHFKDINDSLGHAAGDQTLQSVARALESSLREYDICARWGGEEFLLLIPITSEDQASVVAERLRRAVSLLPPPAPALKPCTISIGFTRHHPGERLDDTLLRADQALYQAKADGRNRVVGI